MIINIFKLVHNDVPFEIFQRNPITPPNKYYDRVYLCMEDIPDNNNMPINGFICKQFDDFEFAEKYLQDIKIKNRRQAMIPICKWSPKFLDPFFLNMYLKKLFWIGKIKIRRF